MITSKKGTHREGGLGIATGERITRSVGSEAGASGWGWGTSLTLSFGLCFEEEETMWKIIQDGGRKVKQQTSDGQLTILLDFKDKESVTCK